MRKIIPALIAYLVLTSAAFAARTQCDSLNNTAWKSDEFNAILMMPYRSCVYTAVASFQSQGESMQANLRFHKIKGSNPLCKPVMHFQLEGTCQNNDLYPIQLRGGNTSWRGFWAQKDRIGLDAIIPFNDGNVNGSMMVYMVQ